jgi:hypothetical protein
MSGSVRNAEPRSARMSTKLGSSIVSVLVKTKQIVLDNDIDSALTKNWTKLVSYIMSVIIKTKQFLRDVDSVLIETKLGSSIVSVLVKTKQILFFNSILIWTTLNGI